MNIKPIQLTRLILLGICCLRQYAFSLNSNDSWEAALRDKLLANQRMVRPAKFGDKVSIDILLVAKYLQEINTARQTFSIVIRLVLYWQDDSLRWNPADHDNATMIELPVSKVWTPSISISNSANLVSNPDKLDVDHTGQVTTFISDAYTTMCIMDATFFPFDTQTCKIVVRGWGRSANFFENYTAIGIITNSFLVSNEWQFMDAWIKNNYLAPFNGRSYTSQPEFIFEFKRRPDFYVATMIVPLVILSFLGLLVFPLPVDSGEKVSYGITCFLSFFIVQTCITQHLPSSFSQMPYMVVALQLMMFMNAVFLMMTITSVRIALKKPFKKMPRCLQCLVKRPNKIDEFHTLQDTPQTTQVIDLRDQSHRVKKRRERDKGSSNPSDRIIERSNPTNENASNEDEWKSVIDSANMMFFWLFVFALIVMIVVVTVSMAT